MMSVSPRAGAFGGSGAAALRSGEQAGELPSSGEPLSHCEHSESADRSRFVSAAEMD
jgi:hypothetical protein